MLRLIVNIDGATDLHYNHTDKILVSDNGTKVKSLLSQVDTLFSHNKNTYK